MISTKKIIPWLLERTAQHEYKEFLAESLLDLCLIDTVPTNNIEQTAENENRVFNIIEKLINKTGLSGEFKKEPISEQIKQDSAYTVPFYSDKTEKELYSGRNNLLFLWDSPKKVEAGRSIAVNAHIDLAAPYFNAERMGETLFGRGVCDDKSGCMVMVGALRLLKEISQEFGVFPGKNLTFMFVIDEEQGGNGSLSVALSGKLKERCDMMVILECCDQQIYPANRGALWYKIEIPEENSSHAIRLAAEIILELEIDGAKIKAESKHPLFPHRPVQTCHGIFGPFGEHPSRICGEVQFLVKSHIPVVILKEWIEKGLLVYTRQYGDKTKVIDASTGKPKVVSHYDLEMHTKGFLLTIRGRTGHMGSIIENDGAITKASFIIKEICSLDPYMEISFLDKPATSLILEGGQGFLPTHHIEEIRNRFNLAILRACNKYVKQNNIAIIRPKLSCNKIHNNAFAGNAQSLSVIDAVECAEAVGIEIKKPVRGWDVSCDARLFADIYKDMEIITTGPGKLEYAHSDEEQINLVDLRQSSAFLALFILVHSGAIEH